MPKQRRCPNQCNTDNIKRNMLSNSVKLDIKNKQNKTYKEQILSLEKEIKILKQQHNNKKIGNNPPRRFMA